MLILILKVENYNWISQNRLDPQYLGKAMTKGHLSSVRLCSLLSHLIKMSLWAVADPLANLLFKSAGEVFILNIEFVLMNWKRILCCLAEMLQSKDLCLRIRKTSWRSESLNSI